MKKLVLSLIIATLAFMVGCTKNSGSTSVDEFLDSYEKIVVKYEEMASNGALTSGDLGVMMKAVNDMNMANLEISNKAEALKDQEWNDAQKMRQINLGSRFSQAMMNMSNQTSNGNGSITSSPDKSITKKDLQELKMSKTKNVDLCRDSVGMLMFKGLIATQQIQQFKDQHIGETFETSLLVGDISKSHDHYIITSPVLDSGKNIIVKLYALTDDDVTKISKISLGSLIKLKGVYKDLTDTYIEIGPAILIDELQEEIIAAQKELANAEQEKAKLLERENLTKPDIERMKTEPDNRNKSAILETYVCLITKKDRINSHGVKLTDPVLILMQDRANVHKFGNAEQDTVDKFFSDATHRARIRSYIERGSFPANLQDAIQKDDDTGLQVSVLQDQNGQFSLQISSVEVKNKQQILPQIKANLERFEFIDSESNFRVGPGTSHAIKYKPLKGTVGTLIQKNGRWIRIQLENGDSGWAHQQNLRIIR